MMVVSRSDVKKRKKDSCDVSSIQHSPKRTKVHAQRKFAQGSNLNSPHLTPVKDKDKIKVNGNVTPTELLPAKRPNTEDFLTFLCFRGTNILPPRLDFFSVASAPETPEEEVKSTDNKNAGPVAGSSRVSTRSLDRNSSDQVMSVVKADARTRSKPKSTSAVLALKKKYHEQRLAKQKTSLTKLAQKVKGKNMVRTRSAALLEETRSNKSPLKSHGIVTRAFKPKAPQKILPRRHHTPVKRLVAKHLSLRAGLRSSGNLPPGSDIGIRSDRKPRKVMKVRPVVQKSVSKAQYIKTAKMQVKQTNSLSDFSSDDDQPLIKKKRTRLTEKVVAVVETVRTRSRQNLLVNKDKDKTSVSSRPTRKTKEAATLFMEMLGKDLRSADDEFGDDDDDDDDDSFSVESFPELPCSRKLEQQEREIRTLAVKNAVLQKDKQENKKKELKKEKQREDNSILNKNKVSVDRKLIKRSVVKLNAIKNKDFKKPVPTILGKEKISVKGKLPIKESILAKGKSPLKEKLLVKEKVTLKDINIEVTSKKPKNMTSSNPSDKKQLPETRKRRGLKNIAHSNVINTRNVRDPLGQCVRLQKTHSNLGNEYFSDSDEEPLKNVSRSSCSVKAIKKNYPVKRNTMLGIKKEKSNEIEKKQNIDLQEKEYQGLEKKSITGKEKKVLIKKKSLKKLSPKQSCNFVDKRSLCLLTTGKSKVSMKNRRNEANALQNLKIIKKSDYAEIKETKTSSEKKAVLHKIDTRKKNNIVNKNHKGISLPRIDKKSKEHKNVKYSEEDLFAECESSHESVLSEDEPLANVLQRSVLEQNEGNKKSCVSRGVMCEAEQSLNEQEIINVIKNTVSVSIINKNGRKDVLEKQSTEVIVTPETISEPKKIIESVDTQNKNTCNSEDYPLECCANENLSRSLVQEVGRNRKMFDS